jgi:hypothetical protein
MIDKQVTRAVEKGKLDASLGAQVVRGGHQALPKVVVGHRRTQLLRLARRVPSPLAVIPKGVGRERRKRRAAQSPDRFFSGGGATRYSGELPSEPATTQSEG